MSDLEYLKQKYQHYADLVLTSWDNFCAHQIVISKVNEKMAKTKSKSLSKKHEEELGIETRELQLASQVLLDAFKKMFEKV